MHARIHKRKDDRSLQLIGTHPVRWNLPSYNANACLAVTWHPAIFCCIEPKNSNAWLLDSPEYNHFGPRGDVRVITLYLGRSVQRSYSAGDYWVVDGALWSPYAQFQPHQVRQVRKERGSLIRQCTLNESKNTAQTSQLASGPVSTTIGYVPLRSSQLGRSNLVSLFSSTTRHP